MKKLLMLIAMGLMFTGIGTSIAPTDAQAQSYRSDRGAHRPIVRRAQVRRAQRARAYRYHRRASARRAYRGHRGYHARPVYHQRGHRRHRR